MTKFSKKRVFEKNILNTGDNTVVFAFDLNNYFKLDTILLDNSVFFCT